MNALALSLGTSNQKRSIGIYVHRNGFNGDETEIDFLIIDAFAHKFVIRT